MIASLVILLVCMLIATLLGLSIAFVGIWALADTTSLAYQIRILMSGTVDMVGMYFSLVCPIVFGFLTLLPFGFSVALTQVAPAELQFRKVGRTLGVLLIVMALIQLPLIIAPMAMASSVTASSLLTGMITSMNSQFVGLPQSWSENRALSLLWSKIMISQSCCGISGTTDFTSNFGTRASLWYTNYRTYTMSNGTAVSGSAVRIPADCCVLTSQAILNTNDYSNIRSYLVSPDCPVSSQSSLASTGCYNILNNYLVVYTGVVFAILLVVQVFEVFVIVMAFYAASGHDSIECCQGSEDCQWLCMDCCESPAKVEPVREFNQYNRYTDGFSNQPVIKTYSNRLNGVYFNTK